MPGSVESAVSAGCHEMIRDGMATLITDAAEAVEAIGGMGELAPPRVAAREAADDLDAVQSAVLGVLPVRRPAAVSDLARRCGLTVPEVTSALGLLRVNGLAEPRDDGWRKAAQSPKR
jgi:DNA processing protein